MKYRGMISYAATALVLMTTACGRASFQSIGPGPESERTEEEAAVNPGAGTQPSGDDAVNGNGERLPQNPGSDQPNNPIAIVNRAPILNCPAQLTLGVGEWVRANLCRATDPDNDVVTFTAGRTNCLGYRVSSLGYVDGRVGNESCDLVITVSDGKLEASASIRIDGQQWNQTIGGDHAAPRGFFNESDGALAIFNWQLTQPHSLVSLAFSDDKGELMAWDGRSSQLPRGKVIQNFANCHPLTRSATTGPLSMTTAGNCGINLAAVLSERVPAAKPWEKRFLRFAASNGMNPGDTFMS
ncbi:MAG: hypothetical protein M3Q07_02455, partial [Pseudobdellovibrionaceae bacterium]|nr:hypothetical protein [Pseudobdellovibrionaceae bacterium]